MYLQTGLLKTLSYQIFLSVCFRTVGLQIPHNFWIFLGLITLSFYADAHSGRLDSENCHVCRSNCEQLNLVPFVRHCHGTVQLKNNPFNELRIDYSGGFTIWLDCAKRGVIKFQYSAQRDTGNAKRLSSFFVDPDVPNICQQTSVKSYKRPIGKKPTYDRGHLVPANHMDNSDEAIRQSNYMTNVLPQVRQMNRGAWLRTEKIIECYRDIDELLVIGGVIWGDDLSDDFFMNSHGVETPSSFWKIIIRGVNGDTRVISWIIPNSAEATHRNLDTYLVSINEIEELTGEFITVDEFLKDNVSSISWIIPRGCSQK